ncbi:50S ribosomal protein L15 [Porphyridium purpureum]|uniref:50S ribosomal protein L15 n=1 Tax=Porphyridium purpureum TaxID=35688 RepID=A0A5J4Z048_PORPP|nr:50S ribosomal protein L15 [Porphyridium purpureum]|eukprot:POR8620..scf208_2
MAAFVGASGSAFFAAQRTASVNVAVCGKAGVRRAVAPSMKVFDWKKRGAEAYSGRAEMGEMSVTTVIPAPGSRKRKTRKGRGVAAGQGRSCGFGMRGQKSRSGNPTRPGFEGGQTPLYRRLPKYVGRPMGPGHTKTMYNLVKLDILNKCAEGEVVTFDALVESGKMTKGKFKLAKIMGGAELTVKNLTVKAHAFTSSAVEAIEAAGGKCVLLSPTTGEDINMEELE